MRHLLILAIAMFFQAEQTENKVKEIKVEKMVIKWETTADAVSFEVFAPTDGWVALGFNSANNIVGTNLIMGASKNSMSKVEDQYVVSVGVHKETKSIGSKSSISNFSCIENGSGTTMKFSISQKQLDKFHCSLLEETKIWFICAYSEQDDFEHHSIMRQHIEVII